MSRKYVESLVSESGYKSLTESDFEAFKHLVSFQSYSNDPFHECPDDKLIVEMMIDKKNFKIKRVKSKSGEYIGFNIIPTVRNAGWFISGCENNIHDCLKL